MHGKRVVESETYAVYGPGLTLEQMKWVLDFQVVRGVNRLTHACFPYNGVERAGRVSVMSNLFLGNPLFDFQAWLNDYAARVCHVMRQGEPEYRLFLYYPITPLAATLDERVEKACETLAHELIAHQYDFCYLDDASILGENAQERAAATPVLVVPQAWDDSDKPGTWRDVPQEWPGEVLCVKEGALEDLLAILDRRVGPTVRLMPKTRAISCACRKVGDERIYFLLNEENAPLTVTAQFDAPGDPVLLDAETGRAAKLTVESAPGSEQSLRLSFGPWESKIIIFGAQPGKKGPLEEPTIADMTLDGPWETTLVKRYEIEPERIAWENCEEPLELTLGDWSGTHPELSGAVRYETTFDAPEHWKGRRVRINLGEVRYVAEIALNGTAVTTRCWRPFTADIAPRLRPGENRLAVTVTNTLANQYHRPDVIEDEKRRGWFNTYREKATEFEADSLPSGLIGPVTVRVT